MIDIIPSTYDLESFTRLKESTSLTYHVGSRLQSKSLITLIENSVYVHQKHSQNNLVIMLSIEMNMNQPKCVLNLVL